MSPAGRQPRQDQQAGGVAVVTMIFLVLFASLAIAFAASANGQLAQARNHTRAQQAQLAAESGLQFMLAVLQELNVSPQDARDDPLAALADGLLDQLGGSANLDGQTVEIDDANGLVRVPPIALGGDMAFQANLRLADLDPDDPPDPTDPNDCRVWLDVRGNGRALQRGVRMQVSPDPRRSGVFDFGVASKSRIAMTGNARVSGVNDPNEARILSGTEGSLAFDLTGNVDLAGDISTTACPPSGVDFTGNVRIGGTSDPEGIWDHIHCQVGHMEFPEVDPSVFEPFATGLVNSSTKTSGNQSFENIRIQAGTNPNFSGNITVRGVVYIEAPNRVKFSGNLDFIGVIVTEDAGDGAYNDNTIEFVGNFDNRGVEDLPDQAAFATLRQLPGSMLLAPGFGVKFSGNANTFNGTIAADKFTFVGNAGGTVNGTVICYSDSDFSLVGNSHLRINRAKYPHEPPGFTKPFALEPVPDSYEEY